MPIDRICANPSCGASFQAKPSDVARGWAECCSKPCSASLRELKRRHTAPALPNEDQEIPITREAAVRSARRETLEALFAEIREAADASQENGYHDAADHVRELLDALESGKTARSIMGGVNHG